MGKGAMVRRGQAPTPRELEVFRAYVETGMAKHAAERLDLSLQTIKNHCANLYAKLGAESALDALLILGWLRFPTCSNCGSVISPTTVRTIVTKTTATDFLD